MDFVHLFARCAHETESKQPCCLLLPFYKETSLGDHMAVLMPASSLQMERANKNVHIYIIHAD